jgi:hypothetical protein
MTGLDLAKITGDERTAGPSPQAAHKLFAACYVDSHASYQGILLDCFDGFILVCLSWWGLQFSDRIPVPVGSYLLGSVRAIPLKGTDSFILANVEVRGRPAGRS